jgi:hypothetical protein
MSLNDSIAVLAATAPPSLSKKEALAAVNGQIITLESQLGLKHKLMPILNPARANSRLDELQQLAATKATTTPIVTTSPLAARQVEPTGSPTLDASVLAAGVHNLAELKAKTRRDQLFATAASTAPGTLSRQCAESKLAAAQAALKRYN